MSDYPSERQVEKWGEDWEAEPGRVPPFGSWIARRAVDWARERHFMCGECGNFRGMAPCEKGCDEHGYRGPPTSADKPPHDIVEDGWKLGHPRNPSPTPEPAGPPTPIPPPVGSVVSWTLSRSPFRHRGTVIFHDGDIIATDTGHRIHASMWHALTIEAPTCEDPPKTAEELEP